MTKALTILKETLCTILLVAHILLLIPFIVLGYVLGFVYYGVAKGLELQLICVEALKQGMNANV